MSDLPPPRSADAPRAAQPPIDAALDSLLRSADAAEGGDDAPASLFAELDQLRDRVAQLEVLSEDDMLRQGALPEIRSWIQAKTKETDSNRRLRWVVACVASVFAAVPLGILVFVLLYQPAILSEHIQDATAKIALIAGCLLVAFGVMSVLVRALFAPQNSDGALPLPEHLKAIVELVRGKSE